MREIDMPMTSSSRSDKKRCAIPTKCNPNGSGSLTDENWEEFVIRYDRESGRYITHTVCCAGAPTCC